MFDNHIYTHGETPYVYRKPQKAKKNRKKLIYHYHLPSGKLT